VPLGIAANVRHGRTEEHLELVALPRNEVRDHLGSQQYVVVSTRTDADDTDTDAS
jgi:hypothetical protein